MEAGIVLALARGERVARPGAEIVEPGVRERPRAGGEQAVGVDASQRQLLQCRRRVDRCAPDLRRIRVPRRRGIEHDAAAERRLAAQHDPVAARGDDRALEPQLCLAAVHANDPRRHRRRPVADLNAGAVLDLALESDVEPVAHGEGAASGERVAARDAAPPLRRDRHRHALPGIGALDRFVVHLDAPHTHLEACRQHVETVAGRDAARPQRPGRDATGSWQAEDSVDVEPGRGVRAHAVGGGAVERCAEIVQPLAGRPADGHHLGAGDEVADVGDPLRLDGVDLRQRDDAALDAEQAKDLQVLVRLRSRPLAGVDDQQEEVDPAGAGDHGPHEALVTGHVDHRESAAARQVERRVPELDRDAAPAFLGKPVGVGSGQGLDERRLAVVDVTRGAERQRHARTAAATRSTSSSAIVRQSSSVRSPRTSATTGGSAARRRAASSSSSSTPALGRS